MAAAVKSGGQGFVGCFLLGNVGLELALQECVCRNMWPKARVKPGLLCLFTCRGAPRSPSVLIAFSRKPVF